MIGVLYIVRCYSSGRVEVVHGATGLPADHAAAFREMCWLHGWRIADAAMRLSLSVSCVRQYRQGVREIPLHVWGALAAYEQPEGAVVMTLGVLRSSRKESLYRAEKQ